MKPSEELPLSRELPVPEDVGRELAHHLAEREAELRALGWNEADARDVDGAAGVIIVNQRLVETFFKDRDPVGHRIQLQSGMDGQGEGWLTIIGVVGDVRHNGLTRDAYPETHVPLHQRPTRGRDGVLVIEATEGNPDALRASVEAMLRAVVPDAVPTR